MAASPDLGALMAEAGRFSRSVDAIHMEQPMRTTKGDTIFGEKQRINKRVALIEAQYTLELHFLSGKKRVWHF